MASQKAARRRARLRDDTDVEVLSGLRPGEKLVVLPINGKGRRKFNVNDGN